MAGDQCILELARTIRPYLDELLADQPNIDADKVDHDLAGLVAAAQRGDRVNERILALLEEPPEVHDWAAAFLQYGYPPELAALFDRSIQSMPGYGEALLPPKFSCPHGDFVFYRRNVNQQVPRCRTHHIDLVAAASR